MNEGPQDADYVGMCTSQLGLLVSQLLLLFVLLVDLLLVLLEQGSEPL